MATYYVTTSGNAANPGTLASPWTLAKAFLSAVAGDVVYIAPGTYVGTFTASNAGSAGNTISFIGDPTASISWGLSAGVVRITNITTDNALPTVGNLVVGTSTHYLSFTNLLFEGYSTNALIIFTTSTNISFTQCAFTSIRTASTPEYAVRITGTAGVAIAASMNRCIGNNVRCLLQLFAPTHSGAYNLSTTITNCLNVYGGVYWMDTNGGGTASNAGGITVYNTTALYDDCIRCYSNQTTFPSYVYNSILFAPNVCMLASTTGALVENYNRTFGQRFSVNTGANTVTAGRLGFEFGQSLLFGIPSAQIFSTYVGSPAVAGGTTSGAPLTDLYANLWSNTTPDNGSATYKPVTSITGYIPTERNASTITIAPGSTSQSIELYLGATGLTASTSGLSAYYNRTRSADVQIPLVARNITQNWTSGGFAEVNANTMPGVYRLDIPNEALAAGADDVTVVVRGASGTNGAVMSIKLSSGGLTTAQTASAVWGALTNDHTTHGTFGWNTLRADQTSKQGLVTLHSSGNVNRVDADVHAIANDTAAATALKGALNHDGTGYVDSDVVRISTSTAAANELEGALLHNGTDYIDSNLLSGNSTRVFVGRFQLTQTGTTQGDIIEAFTTDTPAFELQLFDGDNNIVPVTGATLGLRILDVTSTVVETGTPTIEYGTGGIVRWTAPGSYVSIGCPAGMYRLFVDRTVSGTTTTFGPLQIKVQVQ